MWKDEEGSPFRGLELKDPTLQTETPFRTPVRDVGSKLLKERTRNRRVVGSRPLGRFSRTTRVPQITPLGARSE